MRSDYWRNDRSRGIFEKTMSSLSLFFPTNSPHHQSRGNCRVLGVGVEQGMEEINGAEKN